MDGDFRTRPGPQPHDRIAATAWEQLQRALGPVEPEPLPEPLRSQVLALVHQEITGLVQQLPAIVRKITKKPRRRRAS